MVFRIQEDKFTFKVESIEELTEEKVLNFLNEKIEVREEWDYEEEHIYEESLYEFLELRGGDIQEILYNVKGLRHLYETGKDMYGVYEKEEIEEGFKEGKVFDLLYYEFVKPSK